MGMKTFMSRVREMGRASKIMFWVVIVPASAGPG